MGFNVFQVGEISSPEMGDAGLPCEEAGSVTLLNSLSQPSSCVGTRRESGLGSAYVSDLCSKSNHEGFSKFKGLPVLHASSSNIFIVKSEMLLRERSPGAFICHCRDSEGYRVWWSLAKTVCKKGSGSRSLHWAEFKEAITEQAKMLYGIGFCAMAL